MVDVRHKFTLFFVLLAAGGAALAASVPRILPYSVGVVLVGSAVLGLVVLGVEGYLRGPSEDAAEG